ncbi:MAG: heme NO-binding domain-containing protein [Bacteroidetes bacterium]|jgi:hypothetical protein|nr:heme NO-binding domain-containing protein [Bacteroidota bacterium]
MKGIVFSELLEMTEEVFGQQMLQKVIEKAELSNNGVYVSAGNYPFSELARIVSTLSAETNKPAEFLLEEYGKYLFQKMSIKYAALFDKIPDPISFLSKIDNYIHVEVHKLYPGAETPRFIIIEQDEKHIIMDYISSRGLDYLAIGMIKGCSTHYKVPLDIRTEKNNDEHNSTRFFVYVSEKVGSGRAADPGHRNKGVWAWLKRLFS